MSVCHILNQAHREQSKERKVPWSQELEISPFIWKASGTGGLNLSLPFSSAAVAAAVLEITSLRTAQATGDCRCELPGPTQCYDSLHRVYFLRHISGVISFFKFQNLPNSYEGTGNFNEKHLMLENFCFSHTNEIMSVRFLIGPKL